MQKVVVTAIVIALLGISHGCGPKADATGHRETGIFVDCDPNGFTVKNDGDLPRYLNINELCSLNSKQIPGIRQGGEVPDMVLYSSDSIQPKPFTGTIRPGGQARHDLKLTEVGHCMDQTNAPPGSTNGQVFSLISDGPADAIHMNIRIIWAESGMDRQASIRVACKW